MAWLRIIKSLKKMKVLYKDAELVIVSPKGFTDNVGVEVEYNECTFRIEDEDGIPFSVVLNSKAVKPSDERHTGLLEVEVDNEGKRKPKLISFKVE